MVRSRPRLTALLLAATVAITACTPTPAQQPPPTAAPLSASPTPAEPAPTAQQQTEANIVEVDPEVLAELAGLTTPSETSLEHQFFAVWPELDTHPAFSDATRTFATGEVTQFIDDYPASPDQLAQPELGVNWRLVASSPSMVGIIQDAHLNSGASATQSWRTVWYDLDSQQVIANDDLVNDPEALTTEVVRALQGLSDVSYLEGNFSAATAPMMAFTPAGELVVGFDDGQAGPMSLGRIYATLTPEVTTGLLSQRGRQARDAAVKPTLITPDSTIEPTIDPVDDPTDPVDDPTDQTDETSPTASSSPTSPTSKPAPSQPRAGRPDCSKLKCVALTFDDGPSTHTTKLVADLKALDAPATFYVLGSQVDTYPTLTRQMAANGNELGVHTWSHPELTKKSSATVDSEIARTKKIIVDTTGVTPTTYRPPYGATNSTVRSIAGQNGLAEIMWTVDTMDWRDRNSSVVASRAIDQARPGSIILMHDIHKTTVAAVPDVVTGLRAKGYTLVTVSDLLGSPQPGKRYNRR